MEEETLEQKQKYLRENVLEKGYDPDKFMEFLTMKKGEQGINLDIWTLQELIEVTREFLLNNKLDIEINLADNKNKEEDKEEDNEKENKNENIPKNIDEKSNLDENNFGCFLIEQTPISKTNNLDIEITKPKVEKSGIFSWSYSTYLIVTSTLNLQVRRKYSDFEWLYNILKKLFGNCIVPPFFKKKENLDENKMKQRIYFMEKFLNGIAVHPILRNSKIFYDFLAINDEKEFIKSKKVYGNNKAPSSIKQFKTLNSEIKVSFYNDTEEYFDKIKIELNEQDSIYENLLYHYKLLLLNINNTILQMKEISNIWKELYNLKNENIKCEATAGIYNSYIKIMDQWANLQINNCDLIRKSIKKFFRFIKEEYNCFKDLSYIVDDNKNIYYKKNKKLLNAKENFFAKLANEKKEKNVENNIQENEIENYEEIEFNKLMSKDVIKVNELKMDYGCYLNIYINEYERLRNLNIDRFKKNLLDFIKELCGQLSRYTFSLGENMSFIDSITN